MNLSEKINKFKEFYNTSKKRYKAIERKFGNPLLKAEYFYEVCPGGSRGGFDNLYVEVFYGYRVFNHPRVGKLRKV